MDGLELKFDFDDGNDDGIKPMDTSPDRGDEADRVDTQQVRLTRGKMTKYEKARIIGARATLLAKGAQPLVKIEGETDLLEIARKELYAKVLPISITRKLPDGTIEEWRVQELELPKE